MFYDQIWWKRVFGRGPVEDIHWYIANLSKFLLSAEKWEGFLIKNWDLRSKNYWYGWEKPTVIPASLCSHPVNPKSCKRKSWTSAYAQKFKTNFKHSYYSLGIMLWIRCLRSIYKNKWQQRMYRVGTRLKEDLLGAAGRVWFPYENVEIFASSLRVDHGLCMWIVSKEILNYVKQTTAL